MGKVEKRNQQGEEMMKEERKSFKEEIRGSKDVETDMESGWVWKWGVSLHHRLKSTFQVRSVFMRHFHNCHSFFIFINIFTARTQNVFFFPKSHSKWRLLEGKPFL